jgi:hypothetical protein
VRHGTLSFNHAWATLPRQLGETALQFDEAALAAAQRACEGWQPLGWRVHEAARLLLMLDGPADADAFIARTDKLFRSAELSELVMLYRALPLYPQPLRWRARAAEGLRSNMKVVFEAVALRNPYPWRWLEEPAWNQLVVKALFVGSRMPDIVGLDERANPRLTRMLIDFASERRSAQRPVDPWLWRFLAEPA